MSSDSTRPAYVLRPASPPLSYDDPQGVRSVRWDPATPGDLLVWLADDSIRRISHDSSEDLATAAVEYGTGGAHFAAVTTDREYWVYYLDGSATVETIARGDGELLDTLSLDGWVTGVAVNGDGEVLVTTWDHLVLPSGSLVSIEGGINNLAW